MKWNFWILSIITLAAAFGGGFYLAKLLESADRIQASQKAERFLLREGGKLSDYFGPVLGREELMFRVYSWRSLSSNPPAILEVTLGEDLVCLYEVVGANEYRRVLCSHE